jgi:hypothetical protein
MKNDQLSMFYFTSLRVLLLEFYLDRPQHQVLFWSPRAENPREVSEEREGGSFKLL